MPKYRQLEDYVDAVQATGRYYFLASEVKDKLLLNNVTFNRQVNPLLLKKHVAFLRRDFYVIVSPEFRALGAPPVDYYLEGLMQFLGRPYYVGLLNAAAWYGAAHQQPQRYAVVTVGPTMAAIEKDYTAIDFIYKKAWSNEDVIKQKTNAGYLNVSSPELTALDLCYYSKHAGGINQVATVIQELGEEMQADRLLALIKRFGNIVPVQRLAYLLELTGYEALTAPIKEWLVTQRYYPALLEAGDKDIKSRVTGNDWKIIVNTEIETDL